MSAVMYTSAVNVTKARELFAESGVLCPHPSVLHQTYNKVKEEVMLLSQDQVKKNRQEHIAASRNVKDYPGDVI